MGTPCEIQVFAESRHQADYVFELIIEDVTRLEAKYSRYREDSLISAINRVAAVGGSISVDTETAELLNYAHACHEQSQGLFDISSGILRAAWRFRDNALPDQYQIDALLARVGWHHIHWRLPVMEFTMPGMEIDFGGIVKEYAVDRAAQLCLQAGVDSGLVNLGGDLKIVGPRKDGQPWRIGIHHPRAPKVIAQTLLLHHGAVASSGDYERCIVFNGRRYGHVLNPKTGWPVQRLASVTVVSDFCVIAGSASTIAMLKEGQGPDWLEAVGLPHLWFDIDGNKGGTL